MQALFDYIIKPKGKRYNNSVDVDGGELIINTEVYNHQYINREAEVVAVPKNGSKQLKVGDTIIVHHNVFRRWHDVRGNEKNSRSYYKDGTYIVKEDQIFLYKRSDKWKPLQGYCFIQPIKSIDSFDEAKERPLIGIVKHTDGTVDKGDLVGFTPWSEFEFVVDNQRLYRVLSKDISIKYEYQGDEEEYNPSWA
jgi:co-chaperonin GroES (HSP10)